MANNRNDWSDLTNQQRSKARNEQTQKARNKTQRQRAEQRNCRSEQTESIAHRKREYYSATVDKVFQSGLRLPKAQRHQIPLLYGRLDPSTF